MQFAGVVPRGPEPARWMAMRAGEPQRACAGREHGAGACGCHEQEERESLRLSRLAASASSESERDVPDAIPQEHPRHDFGRVPVLASGSHVHLSHPSLRAMPANARSATHPPALRARAGAGHAAARDKKIRGVEVNSAHCGCVSEIEDASDWAKFMSKLYSDCGKNPKLKTGSDIEACVQGELTKKGISTTVAGTTSSTGTVTVAPTAGVCGPILDRGTEIHEGVHSATQKSLEKKYGKGTPAFHAAWDNAKNWAMDDANAYAAEVPFYSEVLTYLKALCAVKKPPPKKPAIRPIGSASGKPRLHMPMMHAVGQTGAADPALEGEGA